jgi:uncharacterized membrane protein YjjP (DUF1212 family)
MDIERYKKYELTMKIGKLLHTYGASAERIEAALGKMTLAMNIHADFFSVPTGLFATFKDEIPTYTTMERVNPGAINLAKLSRVDFVVEKIIHGRITVDEALKKINYVSKRPLLYGHNLKTLAYTLTAGAIAVLIQGSWLDVAAASVLGFINGLLSYNVKMEKVDRLYEAGIALVITFATYYACSLGIALNPSKVILASIVNLLPGLVLTIAISELASQNLTSGTARFMAAITIFMKISFGVFFGTAIAKELGFDINPNGLESLSSYYIWAALPIVCASFVVSFQARLKDFKWIFFSGIVSFLSFKLLGMYVKESFSPFLHGVILGAGSNLASRLTNRPALLFILPGITLLVPGMMGLRSMISLFDNFTLIGIETTFKTLVTAVGITSGLFLGYVIIKPRRTM